MSALGEQLKRDHAEAVALELRLNAVDCAQLSAGLVGMGPQFDALRTRIDQWYRTFLKGEREIRALLERAPRSEQEVEKS